MGSLLPVSAMLASSMRRCAVTPTAWWHWAFYAAAIIVSIYAAARLMLGEKGINPSERPVMLWFLAFGAWGVAGVAVLLFGGDAACI